MTNEELEKELKAVKEELQLIKDALFLAAEDKIEKVKRINVKMMNLDDVLDILCGE